MKSISINDIPDAILAGMIRNGCYAKNTRFGNDDKDHAKYLLVLAVPYGPSDNVTTFVEAFESFRELLTADDWAERHIQVLELSTDGQPTVTEIAPEQVDEDIETCEEEDWGDWGLEAAK